MNDRKKYQMLELRVLELEGAYRNSCAHRDEQARQINELERLLQSARSVACTLEAECAVCPDPIHGNGKP